MRRDRYKSLYLLLLFHQAGEQPRHRQKVDRTGDRDRHQPNQRYWSLAGEFPRTRHRYPRYGLKPSLVMTLLIPRRIFGN